MTITELIELAKKEFKGYSFTYDSKYRIVWFSFFLNSFESLSSLFDKFYAFCSHIENYYIPYSIFIERRKKDYQIRKIQLTFGLEKRFPLKEFFKDFLLKFLEFFFDKDWVHLYIYVGSKTVYFYISKETSYLEKCFSREFHFVKDFNDFLVRLMLSFISYEKRIRTFDFLNTKKLRKIFQLWNNGDLKDLYIHLFLMYDSLCKNLYYWG